MRGEKFGDRFRVDVLRRWPWVWLVLASLWVPFFPIVFGLLWEGHTYEGVMLWGAAAFTLMLVVLGWWHPLFFLPVLLLVGLLDAAYAHTAHFWRIGDLSIRVETALDSSPGETAAFFRTFVLRSKFAWFLMGYLALGLALAGLYAWAWRHRRPWPRWPFWARSAVTLLVLVGMVAALYRHEGFYRYPAVHLATTTYEVYRRVHRILERKRVVKEKVAAMPPQTCNDRYEKIVFVLGETANREFMSLYGFPMPTTPFLDGLEGKVVARAISPVNQTMTSVPVIMTPATVLNYEPFYTEPSFLSYLRKCGYQVFWLSNQLRYSPYTSSVSSIASEADVVRFVVEELDVEGFGPPDEILVKELLRPEDVVPGRKQVFVFHLLGSHFVVQDRYPPEKALIPQPKNLMEHYINSIHYTDQVLEMIFHRFRSEGEPMLFVYLSDHGEYVEENRAFHALSNVFQDEYRIPLVFWSTYEEDLAPLARAFEGRLVNAETLDLIMLYLVGLREEPGVSYSTKVLSLGPGRVREYTELPYLRYQEKR